MSASLPTSILAPEQTAVDVCVRAAKQVLRSYQLEWWHSLATERFTAILGARQIGKDFAVAGFVAFECVLYPRTEWQCFSATRYHAKQFLADVKKWVAYLSDVLAAHGYRRPIARKAKVDNSEALQLDNGSRVSSRPSTVKGAVGQRGRVVLNEVPVIQRDQQVYEATYPIVTGAIDNGHDARMVMMGNASERGSFWHQWWTGEKSGGWHKLTNTWRSCMRSIGKAADWIKSRIKQYTRTLGIGAFAQWYDCVWRASEELFLSPALIKRQLYDDSEADWIPRKDLRQWIGYDVGRHVHPAAIVPVVETARDKRHALPGTVLRKTPYPTQRKRVAQVARQRRTAEILVDAGIAGDPQVEDLGRETPYSITPVHMGVQKTLAIFETVREGLESGRLWLPMSDAQMLIEFESITAEHVKGQTKIVVPEDGGGHCDVAVACGLATYGALGRTDTGGPSARWQALYGIS